MRNKEECVCSVCLFRCNVFIGFRIIKEMPGLVGSGTPYITLQSITRGVGVPQGVVAGRHPHYTRRLRALVKKTVFIFVG